MKSGQPERDYKVINDFDLRFGKFYDPNEYLNGISFEIRVLHKDPELLHALYEKIVGWIK